jgi:hypothetical protein
MYHRTTLGDARTLLRILISTAVEDRLPIRTVDHREEVALLPRVDTIVPATMIVTTIGDLLHEEEVAAAVIVTTIGDLHEEAVVAAAAIAQETGALHLPDAADPTRVALPFAPWKKSANGLKNAVASAWRDPPSLTNPRQRNRQLHSRTLLPRHSRPRH